MSRHPTWMYRRAADGEVESKLFDHPGDIPKGEGWTDSPAGEMPAPVVDDTIPRLEAEVSALTAAVQAEKKRADAAEAALVKAQKQIVTLEAEAASLRHQLQAAAKASAAKTEPPPADPADQKGK